MPRIIVSSNLNNKIPIKAPLLHKDFKSEEGSHHSNWEMGEYEIRATSIGNHVIIIELYKNKKLEMTAKGVLDTRAKLQNAVNEFFFKIINK